MAERWSHFSLGPRRAGKESQGGNARATAIASTQTSTEMHPRRGGYTCRDEAEMSCRKRCNIRHLLHVDVQLRGPMVCDQTVVAVYIPCRIHGSTKDISCVKGCVSICVKSCSDKA